MEFLLAFGFIVLCFLGFGVGTFLAGKKLSTTCGASGGACACDSACSSRREGAERMLPVVPRDHQVTADEFLG